MNVAVLKSLTFQIKNSTWITEYERCRENDILAIRTILWTREQLLLLILNLNLQKRTLCQAFQRPTAAYEQKDFMVVGEKATK